MKKYNSFSINLKKITAIRIFILILSFCSNLFTQKLSTPEWVQVNTPIYNNLTSLLFLETEYGFASGKQLIEYKNKNWQKFHTQPPSTINLISICNPKTIFVTTISEYQESIIHFWNGVKWKKVLHPLANTISSIKFKDQNNGVIGGFGEIATLKNGMWNYIPPPSNSIIGQLEVEADSIIWAVTSREGLLKYNSGWKKIKESTTARIIKLFSRTLYVLGNNYFGVVKNDSIIKLSVDNKLRGINAFNILSENLIFACGNNGLILKFDNNQWNKLHTNVKENLNSIYMLNENEGWTVGNDGIILHFTNDIKQDKIPEVWKGFESITFYSDAKLVDDEYGVVAADFNNDDKIDIFTCGLFESNHLYINKGNFRFADEASERGVTGDAESEFSNELNLGACAGDFDNDGHIDLYVSSLTSTNKIYHNLGGGNFVDYSDITGGIGKSTDRTNAVISGDADNDGDLDLFLCNENTTNRFYENNGAGIFTETTSEINLISEYGGMGASFSDIDSDGDIDLFVANWSAKNKLYKNLFAETGKLKFIDFTNSSGVGGEIYTKSNGVVFADIDNDADADIFVTNRKTSNQLFKNNGKGIFTDVTAEMVGIDTLKSYGAVIVDFNNDGFKDIYISNVGENKLYINANGSKFNDESNLLSANVTGYSTGLAAADYDNDNNIDLYVANYIGASSAVLKNKPNFGKSVTIKLEGISNNASAIGAKIYAYKAGHLGDGSHLLSYSEVSGGSGYASMNNLEQIVPCLGSKQIDVKVIFPHGEMVIRDFILSGSKVTVYDVAGYNKRFVRAKKYFTRLFFDPHRLFIVIKWLLVSLFIVFSSIVGIKKYGWQLKNIIITSAPIIIIYSILQSIFEYENIFFSLILPLSSVVVISVFTHFYFERIKLKNDTEIEKQKLKEKLSRDLHDDLASTLSTVTIYLELLKGALKNNSNEVWTYFNKAENLLINAKSSVTDLIWAIKPKPEKLTDFITKLRENFIHPFRENNIQLKIKEINTDDNRVLSSVEKHNIFLIIKESLNNILRHSNATNAIIEIQNIKDSLIIIILDNGVGFNVKELEQHGNGIGNIKRRANEMKANLSIDSAFQKGTKIIIEIK